MLLSQVIDSRRNKHADAEQYRLAEFAEAVSSLLGRSAITTVAENEDSTDDVIANSTKTYLNNRRQDRLVVPPPPMLDTNDYMAPLYSLNNLSNQIAPPPLASTRA